MFPLYDENKSKTTPIVTWTLIVVNSLVFLWEFTQGFDPKIFYDYGEIPSLVLQGKQLFSVVTSMFLHADLWHILGNMIYLFVFGDNVEDRFGHAKFFVLYFIVGIVGGLTHSIVAVMSGGRNALIPTVGASGAVSGVLGAYLVFFPRANVVSIIPSFVFLRLARIPAMIFIGVWFLLQLLFSGSMSGVAYMAHIGGFVIGALLAIVFKLKPPTRALKLPLRVPTVRFCGHCGGLLPDEAVYCPTCGRKRFN